MHQTAKGKQWYFGMKAHIAVDSKTKRWGSRIDERVKAVNRTKSGIRSRVEHTLGIIKRVFGFFRRCGTGDWRRTGTGWKSPRRWQTCSWPERGCGVGWGRHSVCEIRWNRDFAAGAAAKSVLRTMPAAFLLSPLWS